MAIRVRRFRLKKVFALKRYGTRCTSFSSAAVKTSDPFFRFSWCASNFSLRFVFCSRIQKQQQKIGVKKKLLYRYLFFVASNFTKFNIILFLKKKIWASFQKNYRTFYPKICHWALKNMDWDPRSGIRKKSIPYPGSGFRGQKGTESRIRIRNTASDLCIRIQEAQNKWIRRILSATLVSTVFGVRSVVAPCCHWLQFYF